MYKILVVEDDLVIAKAVAEHLSKWELEPRYITDFKEILREFIAFEPHLVLMDIALPFFNGYHWCSEIRKLSNVPIIFISSAGESMNIVMAMNMGGDDFISKPFDLGVLTAKVQALIRRSYSFGARLNVVEYKNVVLNINDSTIIYGDKRVELTKNEFKIAHLLMENRGKIVPRDTIMIRLWESDSFIDDNTLTVNVARLRKKLEDIGVFDFIATRKGVGYIIE